MHKKNPQFTLEKVDNIMLSDYEYLFCTFFGVKKERKMDLYTNLSTLSTKNIKKCVEKTWKIRIYVLYKITKKYLNEKNIDK